MWVASRMSSQSYVVPSKSLTLNLNPKLLPYFLSAGPEHPMLHSDLLVLSREKRYSQPTTASQISGLFCSLPRWLVHVSDEEGLLGELCLGLT